MPNELAIAALERYVLFNDAFNTFYFRYMRNELVTAALEICVLFNDAFNTFYFW